MYISKLYWTLSYFTITGCIWISDLASLLCIPRGITSSAVGLKVFIIAAEIKEYKSVTKKKKHDTIVLLAKSKLNRRKLLICKALIDSVISHK